MLFKSKGHEIKRFNLGDLVYDEYYGSGLVVELDEKFDEMQVYFREGAEWLTTHTVRNLEIVSTAQDRQKVLDKSLTK